jgi:hypothetical protein
MKYYGLEKMLEDLNVEIEDIVEVHPAEKYLCRNDKDILTTTGVITEVNNEDKYLRITSSGLRKMNEFLELHLLDGEKAKVKEGDFVEVMFKLVAWKGFEFYCGELISIKKVA